MLLPSFIQIQKINHYTGHAAGIFSLAQGFAQHEILSGGGDGVIAAWQVGKQENAKGLAVGSWQWAVGSGQFAVGSGQFG